LDTGHHFSTSFAAGFSNFKPAVAFNHTSATNSLAVVIINVHNFTSSPASIPASLAAVGSASSVPI
jgi:hypothetical protein